MIRNACIALLLGIVACSPSGSVSGADVSPPVGPPSFGPAAMDLYWLSFNAEPQGANPLTATVTSDGLLGVAGEIASSDTSFSGEVEILCELDGGVAGQFSVLVNVESGYAFFVHEVPVSQLNVSAGLTYSLEAIIDPYDVWPESAEGSLNNTGGVGFLQYVAVVSPPPGIVDLAAVPGSAAFSPAAVEPGDPLSASVDISNLGTDASGGFDVAFYASTNGVISTRL